jgi:hypothetical protein
MTRQENLVRRLQHIAENEESILMPGSVGMFGLSVLPDSYELTYDENVLVDFMENESDKDTLEWALNEVLDKIESLEFARDVLQFAIREK